MRSAVVVRFGPSEGLTLALDGLAPMPVEEARAWLDEQFVREECVPLRPTGKVLIADKVLALAAAVGRRRFERDAGWSQSYARATSSALDSTAVEVDVAALALSY